MNRDEQKTRVLALPPEIHHLDEARALYPSEPSGGTWIGVNNHGLAFALMNWYEARQATKSRRLTRGIVVKRLLAASTLEESFALMTALPLQRLDSFRLLAISNFEHKLFEGRWNGNEWSQQKHLWKRRHWFSSSYDESRARTIRGKTVAEAAQLISVDTLAWVRRLHRSHQPAAGPFSLCVHRDDAQTVSYTEIQVNTRRAIMAYHSGPLCQRRKMASKELLLK